MTVTDSLDFALPKELEADRPPEMRNLARDDVRLLVSHFRDDSFQHGHFRELGGHLLPGDLLVVNISATINAALKAWRSDGSELELHLSTQLQPGLWTVELRLGNSLFRSARVGEPIDLEGGGTVTLLDRYLSSNRLWLAHFHVLEPFESFFDRYGFPIRYKHVPEPWPLSTYQTVFAARSGSAEMPSAGRAFTADLVTGLVSQGVQFAPITLHTGVASLEDHEPPYPELFEVPEVTARSVNAARSAGSRVIAVGTTVVRALESATDPVGRVHAAQGWSDLVVTPERGVRAVDALITGFHEPRATHLAMLEAIAGREHLAKAYKEALAKRYLWHEFGDLHLLMP